MHEVWLTPAEKREVLADMGLLLGTDDRFALLRLAPRARTLLRGRAQAPADQVVPVSRLSRVIGRADFVVVATPLTPLTVLQQQRL